MNKINLLNNKEIKIRKLISGLNLSFVKKKLMMPEIRGGNNWTSEKSNKHIKEYKGFLFIIWKYPKLKISPPKELDEVWHTHILFTKKYAEHCKKIFGRFIHHNPLI